MKLPLVAAALLIAAFSLAASEGTPVLVPHAQQFDLVAEATGRTYRISIAVPEKMDSAKKISGLLRARRELVFCAHGSEPRGIVGRA